MRVNSLIGSAALSLITISWFMNSWFQFIETRYEYCTLMSSYWTRSMGNKINNKQIGVEQPCSRYYRDAWFPRRALTGDFMLYSPEQTLWTLWVIWEFQWAPWSIYEVWRQRMYLLLVHWGVTQVASTHCPPRSGWAAPALVSCERHNLRSTALYNRCVLYSRPLYILSDALLINLVAAEQYLVWLSGTGYSPVPTWGDTWLPTYVMFKCVVPNTM